MEAAAIPTKHDDGRTARPLSASNETPKIRVIPGGQAANRTPPRHARAPMNCAGAPAPAPVPAHAAPRAASLLARAGDVLARAQGVGFGLTRRERALAAAAGTVFLLMALAAAIL